MAEQLYCPHCRKTMGDTNFYTLKNGQKSDMCKACETMHINNWEPDTFTWLLEKYDVPYVPAEWDVLRDRAYQKDPYKMTGMSVFGKYLSKMKLKQWKNFGWADTERLQTEAEEKAKLYGKSGTQSTLTPEQMAQIQEQYDQGLISEAQYQTYADNNAPDLTKTPYESKYSGDPDKDLKSPYPANSNPFEKIDLPDIGADLTEEDKIYLATKWGVLYTGAEWVQLEKMYEDFKKTFPIEGAAREDTLKFICKTSLKMNAAIDSGDIETYQKLSKVYDAQMKAAKFTEAQNKEDAKKDFDSIGQIVNFAESKKGGGRIPRKKVSVPEDIVDKTIVILQKYYTDLFNNDPTIHQQLESYLKKRQIAEEMKAATATGETYTLTTEDMIAHREMLNKEIEKDEEVTNSESS